MMDLETKYQELIDNLRRLERVLVAFSGGVDSALLLATAQQALGESVLAVTIISPMFTEREREDSIRTATALNARHLFVEVDPLSDPSFVANTPDRCYICKRLLFRELLAVAEREGGLPVVEGSNFDDISDYRPGARALSELGIHSPLKDARLTKPEIRKLCAQLGLDCSEKPSLACLATRIPYQVPITETRLERIDQAEQIVRALGVTQVRVRDYETEARIEIVPDQFDLIHQSGVREKLLLDFQKLGYTRVLLDLAGYRTGSMNDNLSVSE